MRLRLLPLALILGTTAEADAARLQVLLEARREKTGVLYEYSLVNTTRRTITGLRLGFDDDAGLPELASAPVGWSQAGPAAGLGAPPGWTGRVIAQPDADLFAVAWVADDGRGLPPGGKLEGLRVLVPHPDHGYLSSPFRLFFADKSPSEVALVAPRGPEDRQPPALTVTLVPERLTPPDGRMRRVRAQITATDEVDSVPDVRLESITCNDRCPAGDVGGADFGTDDREYGLRAFHKPGSVSRNYTIVYSATDLSGNVATETVVLRVTHEYQY